jgi:hypothetical protein
MPEYTAAAAAAVAAAAAHVISRSYVTLVSPVRLVVRARHTCDVTLSIIPAPELPTHHSVIFTRQITLLLLLLLLLLILHHTFLTCKAGGTPPSHM